MAAENAARRRLAFLFSAAHEVWAASPGLAAFYLDRFRTGVAVEKGLVVPDEASAPRVCCPRCSALFLSQRACHGEASAVGEEAAARKGGATRAGGCKVRVRAVPSAADRDEKKRRKNIKVKPKPNNADGGVGDVPAGLPLTGHPTPECGPYIAAGSGSKLSGGGGGTGRFAPGKGKRDTVFVPTVSPARAAAAERSKGSAGQSRAPFSSSTGRDCLGRMKSRVHKNVVDYVCSRCGLSTRFQGSDSPAASNADGDREAAQTSAKAGTKQGPPLTQSTKVGAVLVPGTAEAAAKGVSVNVKATGIDQQQHKGKQISSAPAASNASLRGEPAPSDGARGRSTSTAKKRKKARQENTLAGMLERSKMQRFSKADGANDTSSPDSFLSSFLSSL